MANNAGDPHKIPKQLDITRHWSNFPIKIFNSRTSSDYYSCE